MCVLHFVGCFGRLPLRRAKSEGIDRRPTRTCERGRESLACDNNFHMDSFNEYNSVTTVAPHHSHCKLSIRDVQVVAGCSRMEEDA
eukprot:2742631-Amphidinium_carterae.1